MPWSKYPNYKLIENIVNVPCPNMRDNSHTSKIVFIHIKILISKFNFRGSIAAAGEAVKWLKTIGLIETAKESEEHAKTVKDTGGVYFVPAYVFFLNI